MAEKNYEAEKNHIQKQIEAIDEDLRKVSENIGRLVKNNPIIDLGLNNLIGDRLRKAQYLYTDRQLLVGQFQLIHNLENGILYK